MHKLPKHSPECCVEDIPDADEHICFFPDIVREYCRLRRQYFRMVTRNRRIWKLAKPRTYRSKYQAPCVCRERLNRKVDIYYADEPLHTRTEQLSYPPASRLLHLKNVWAYKHEFTCERKCLINRLIRKSLMSLYSRLANAQPPKRPEKRPAFTKEQWESHLKKLKIISQPKHKKKKKKKLDTQTPKKAQDAGEDPATKRKFAKLAKPKKYPKDEIQQWQLTERLKTYRPTKRIKTLAKPKLYSDNVVNHQPYAVRKEALSYRPTERIKELAVPSLYSKKRELRTNAFKISENALKAKISSRVNELAKPKDMYDTHTRSNPYSVSPRALRAKATKRLLELAQPRKYN